MRPSSTDYGKLGVWLGWPLTVGKVATLDDDLESKTSRDLLECFESVMNEDQMSDRSKSKSQIVSTGPNNSTFVNRKPFVNKS